MDVVFVQHSSSQHKYVQMDLLRPGTLEIGPNFVVFRRRNVTLFQECKNQRLQKISENE